MLVSLGMLLAVVRYNAAFDVTLPALAVVGVLCGDYMVGLLLRKQSTNRTGVGRS